MFLQNHLKILFLLSCASLSLPSHAIAQIIPDKTTNSQVVPNQIIQGISSDLITAGASKGANLFHGFLELNVASDRGLYFSNPANITNIFARVTGTNPSNILGRLGVLGNANLFLLNPNGILFGENSSLAMSGSLYATTSDRVRFADGSTFSTNNPELPSILTSSIPVGLGFGSNSGISSGMITMRSQANPIAPLPIPQEVLPIIRKPSGLIALPNTTIALIGSDVSIENNGAIFALGGGIELGGVQNGEVALLPQGNKFALSYIDVKKFGNVQLSGNANLTNIGSTEGDIQIVGDRVSLLDKGLVLTASLGNLFSGKISVQANQLIELAGSNNYANEIQNLTSSEPVSKNTNGFISFSVGNSNGGDINLESPKLIARNSSFIVSSILFDGKAGNITIKAPQSVTLDQGAIFSGTAATALGAAGNVDIQTGSLFLLNNGVISSTSLGLGQGGGNVIIDATSSVEVLGTPPIFTFQNIPISGGIITSTISNAIAGNIRVNTPYLMLQNGAVFTTETQGNGNGGAVSITADRIDLSGIDSSNRFPSAIFALTRNGSTGDGGSVNINAKNINIWNGAIVSVASLGTGNAGNLQIVSDNLRLDRQGNLLASTSISGEGGNINLQVRDLLSLQNNSQILASSVGTGNGGNIKIHSGITIGLGNSQINANAFSGNGGNIFINTQGLFFSSDSLITASSELGVSGNIAISSLELSPKNIFVSPVDNFIKVDAIISNSCLTRRNATQGSFVVTGSGGIPENPYNLLVSDYPATSIQSISNSQKSAIASNPTSNSMNPVSMPSHTDKQNWRLGDPIVEVRGLVRDMNGEILPVITYADADALGCSKKVR